VYQNAIISFKENMKTNIEF